MPVEDLSVVSSGRLRAITADTALRFAKFFVTSAQFWLSLQTRHDLDLVEDRVADQLDAITPLQVA